jgi:hypothetical protein
MKEKIQKFGRFLSGMVMPNLGAFVAWGLITALFIPTGWLGKWEYAAELSKTVGPIIVYLVAHLDRLHRWSYGSWPTRCCGRCCCNGWRYRGWWRSDVLGRHDGWSDRQRTS